jgi:hypothetical protein
LKHQGEDPIQPQLLMAEPAILLPRAHLIARPSSVNRLGRFRESEILRHIFERVVAACMAAGLVKGEGFAVDASVMGFAKPDPEPN